MQIIIVSLTLNLNKKDVIPVTQGIEDEDFSDKITQKSYLKYKYQLVLNKLKSVEKREFFENIYQFSQHSQIQNSAQKRGYYIICSLKNNLESQKKKKIVENKFQSTFQLNNNLIEVEKSIISRIRRNRTI